MTARLQRAVSETVGTYDDQDQVIVFLARPETFGLGTRTVERLETHISLIFLGAGRALKLKRAVKFPYLDFSTLEKRRAACEAEFSINRRTAPGIYRGVLPVTRDGKGNLHLGGDGEVVDWVVDMNRFDQEALFDRLAQEGSLNRANMGELAEVIARFHHYADPRPEGGGRKLISSILRSNADTFVQFGPGILDMDKVQAMTAASERALDQVGLFLDQRRDQGRVRRCHGDLHLRNIVMLEGLPVLFDAIEFNNDFTAIDVLYDLAFLLMDLDHRNLRRLANIVLNQYLDVTRDIAGLKALPLFQAVRASIRSHVDASSSINISDRAAAERLADEARDYLDMAIDYLNPPAPRLIAVGGLSGSGKSRMARELAPYLGAAPGARVVRTDVMRKHLAGVNPLVRLGPENYTPEMSEKTYHAVYDEIRTALDAGHSAIADAVFARPEERQAIEAVAKESGVSFHGLWLESPLEIMEERISRRASNASDATKDVLYKQLDYDLGEMTWSRVDSSESRETTLRKGTEILGI
ncbi:MAG: AAA family ATPase [Rhodospirillales bacterium]|nr:AAA family ATPase [Rhodospirillales bacterium]